MQIGRNTINENNDDNKNARISDLTKKYQINGRVMCKSLEKKIANYLNKTKVKYKEIINYDKKNKLVKWQEWLCDNYYIIEREIKFSLNNIREYKDLPYSNTNENRKFPIIFYIALEQCKYYNNKISSENLLEYLICSQKFRSFETKELEVYILMLKFALCKNIYDVCFNNGTIENDNKEVLIESAILSLKFISSYNFEECFEKVCSVNILLSKDPSNIYQIMTDETKQLYRKKVFELSQKNKTTEDETIKILLDKANNTEIEEQKHIGYWLFLKKNNKFENIYIISQIFFPIFLSLIIALIIKNFFVYFIVYLPVWEFYKILLDYIISKKIKPNYLPSIDLKNGVTNEGKTAVVISALITAQKDIDYLKDRLQKIYYANKDRNIIFGLLVDLKDSNNQFDNNDKVISSKISKMIRELNEYYDNSFFLILRNRTYNKMHNQYIGWEKKRGAIIELIKFIKGDECKFLLSLGAIDKLKKSKYIITLDMDTSLSIDAAKELIGAMLHPLNKPKIDKKNRIVTSGYGLVVPRIGTDLKSSNVSLFSKIIAGLGGTETYNNPAFDIYQDLFSEGIFTGKGIFDIEAFYISIAETFEENKILSHDLLEGCLLRTGYLSNLVLVDSFPSGVLTFFDRQHRWVRGDWQTSIYLLKKIYDKKNRKRENPLDLVSKWKIFDNLRRSLTPIAIVFSLFLAVLRKEYLFILFISLLAILGAQIISILDMLFHNGLRALGIKYSTKTYSPVTADLLRGILNFILLPYNAYVSIDAAIRANFRMYISKKKMLEWTTAAETDAKQKGTLTEHMFRMFISILFGFMFLLSPLIIGKILGIAFVLAPFISNKISKKIIIHNKRISEIKREKTTEYAKDMWGYFNLFMNEDNNFLIPDNYQETPLGIVAQRTSPTNIGLSLLCCLVARDFNFISTEKLIYLIKSSINSIQNLSKWKGHLFNWYDIKKLVPLYPRYVSTVDSGNLACSLITLVEGLKKYKRESKEIDSLIISIKSLIEAMNFKDLYSENKKLLYIGIDIDKRNKENENFYDLFMSEARMTSYYLCSKREISKKHWFTLGRLMTKHKGYFGLKSWTGTMFEYFMPHIFLPIYEGSLSFEALHFAIKCQKERVKGKKTPWGISESGFYSFDVALNYQYKAFGVQRLGLKKGLDRELVISPYSTFLTMPFFFEEAYSNLEQLKKRGMYGKFGFYEAADFSQNNNDSNISIVKSYMAHHLGMSFLSVANALLDNIVQNRFMSCMQMLCGEELLQEKLPASVVVYEDVLKKEIPETTIRRNAPVNLELNNISPFNPKAAILSNGYFSSILTDMGVGFINYDNENITRYRKSLIKNPRGVFIIIKDEQSLQSLTYAPLYDNKITYKANINNYFIEYLSKSKEIETKMKVVVCGNYPCESRELKIKNITSQVKNIELLIYFEPTLLSHREEYSHPTFSGLFMRTYFDNEINALIFNRKERNNKTNNLFLATFITGEYKDMQFETMRENVLEKLIGTDGLFNAFEKTFSNNITSSIDNCCAIKFKFFLPAKSVKKINVNLLIGNSIKEIKKNIELIKKEGFAGALKDANINYCHRIKDLNINSGEKSIISELTAQLFYSTKIKNSNNFKIKIGNGYKRLWKYGISGDAPIILLYVSEKDDVLKANIFINSYLLLRKSLIICDLVFLFNEGGQYDRPIYNSIIDFIKESKAEKYVDNKFGIHLVNIHSEEDKEFIVAASSYYIKFNEGLNIYNNTTTNLLFSKEKINRTPKFLLEEKKITNNYAGGYIEEGFVIDDKFKWNNRPPWCLILANKGFGTLLSDSSLGYTFARNSRENKLTVWENDIVVDNVGEKLYIRIDGKTIDICSSGKTKFYNYCAIYEFAEQNISVKLYVFIDNILSAKIALVEINNNSDVAKRIELCYYVEPVIGVSKEYNSKFVNAKIENNILRLSNVSNCNFKNGFAFLTSTENAFFSNDQFEFIQGIWDNGIKENPNDICAVCGNNILISPQKKTETAFIFGYSLSEKNLDLTILKYSNTKKCKESLDNIKKIKSFNDKAYINTPNENLNLLFNNFLPMQIIESRLNSRVGFYQCGGAYGFRDQLQDAIGFCTINPNLLKIQILRCCAHQFDEGDVLHWWHELFDNKKISTGVRTRCSDDLLWLPFAVSEYIEKSNDYEILEKQIRYLVSCELKKDEYEKYVYPDKSNIKESVYDHCIKAIKKGYTQGKHNLMLFGGGDWNDGMNFVGIKGIGESVWLSMFMVLVLERFSRICEYKEDFSNEEYFLEIANELRNAIEEHCWDGQWYLRGFFDDGSMLGSNSSQECKIDILPQSFSAIVGGFKNDRVKKSLQSAKEHLVDYDAKIVKLFTPPFEHSIQNPGYIKGYLPGIRENGGQYTHAAIWYSLGLLKEGNKDLAFEILDILNPINHCDTKKNSIIYKSEPYVLCGDVYSKDKLKGRGGWSWYTGSAGWYYKVVLEEILGIKRKENKLFIEPNIPSNWNEFSVKLYIMNCEINISVKKNSQEKRTNNSNVILLDGKNHNIIYYI